MVDDDRVSSAVQLFRAKFPDLDSDVASYVESLLQENADYFETEGDVHEAVGDLLNGFTVGVTEKEISDLCNEMYRILKPQEMEEIDNTLDVPVHMASLLSNFSERIVDNQSIWMARRDTGSVVNSKKLEKAEAKLKEKQEKKGSLVKFTSNASTCSLKGLESKEDYATVCQQVDRRDVNSSMEASGRHVGDVRLENFDMSYGSRVLLRGANLTVAYGRRYGLIGRNGYGKTTLLRALSHGDLCLPPGLTVFHVEQEMAGDSTPALESVLRADTERTHLLEELSKLQGTVLTDLGKETVDQKTQENGQGPQSSSTVAEIYARLVAIEADKAPARAAVILHGLGFDSEMQKRPTKEFSGGWRMRLSLAQALLAKPDLLLLDEPTNMLDMRALIWLEAYLQKSSNILIIVSHDRSFLNVVATDIIHLTGCRLDTYRGNYDAFERARADRLLAQQREYEAQKAEREHIQQFIDKFRYNAKRASLVQSRIKQLERLPPLIPPEKELKVTIRLPECEKLSSPVLQLDEVCFHYVKDKPILNKVDLSVSSDSRICIVGENGAGKSTLLRLLLGILEPTSGLRHAHRSLRVGYFSQHHVDQLDLGTNSLEFLMRKFPSQTEQVYRSKLASFNITDMLAMQPIGSLSGGQKSRVALAAMCMTNPNMLILDEPTNHLDVETIAALSDALNSFQGGVVLVSHDERLIETVCNEVWVCTRIGVGVDEHQGSRVYALTEGLSQYKKAVRSELDQLLL
ncbi:unnamed protein product [Calicophoron daubneyi]|uniref:ABC transporter domain-containing protein n=1 Tax=Calicophoron daubneyi TaxID=300641 RepID=A0AAV2TAN7_CALDB